MVELSDFALTPLSENLINVPSMLNLHLDIAKGGQHTPAAKEPWFFLIITLAFNDR